jgi:LacI family transcriptional regulator
MTFLLLEDLIKIGDWRKDSGFRLTKELLKLLERPTGIVAANTFMALGGFTGSPGRGFKGSQRLALVSFDDLEFVLNPPLTTFKSLDTKIGEVAASLLLKRIKNRTEGKIEEIYVPTELVIRSSCGCEIFGNLDK